MVLTKQGATLLFDGVARGAFGLDMYNSLGTYLQNNPGAQGDWQTDIPLLASGGFRLVRAFCTPYWASQWSSPANYAPGTDNCSAEMMGKIQAWLDLCEQNGVGVILVMFWRLPTLSDLRHGSDNTGDWATASGVTRTTFRNVVTQIVTAFKDHPAVAAWELGNEWAYIYRNRDAAAYSDASTLGGKATYLPTGVDAVSSANFRDISTEFAALVRSIDTSGRLILNGTGQLFRGSASDGDLSYDLRNAMRYMVRDASSFDAFTPHLYPSSLYQGASYANLTECLRDYRIAGAQERKPVILEEWGVPADHTRSVGGTFMRGLRAVEESGIQAALAWSFTDASMAGADEKWRIRPTGARSYMWNALSAANAAAWSRSPSGVVVRRERVRSVQFARGSASSNQHLSVADALILKPGAAFSVSFWMRRTGTAVGNFGRVIAKKSSGETTAGWEILFTNLAPNVCGAQIQTTAGNTRTVTPQRPVLRSGRWHHVVFTFDPAEPLVRRAQYWFDGHPVNSQGTVWIDGDVFAHSTQPLTIFATPAGGSPAPVDLREVRYWGRALGEDDIVNQALGYEPASRDDLIAEWLFAGNFNDSSGNGMHLTATGSGPSLMSESAARSARGG